ncbi:MAG: hypothetical protein RIT04_556 [Candidatus Parcubacteria bacterium]|jgi:hypothetical protein
MSTFLSPDLNIVEETDEEIQVRRAHRVPHRIPDAEVPDYYLNPLEALLAKEELMRHSHDLSQVEPEPVEVQSRSADWALDRPANLDWKWYYDTGYNSHVMLSTNPEQFLFTKDVVNPDEVERKILSKRAPRGKIWVTDYKPYQSHGRHGRKRRRNDKFNQPTCW